MTEHWTKSVQACPVTQTTHRVRDLVQSRVSMALALNKTWRCYIWVQKDLEYEVQSWGWQKANTSPNETRRKSFGNSWKWQDGFHVTFPLKMLDGTDRITCNVREFSIQNIWSAILWCTSVRDFVSLERKLMKRTTRYHNNDIDLIVNKEIVQINRLAG